MKNVVVSFFFVFIFPFWEMNCANQNKPILNLDETVPLIFFSKEKCRGFCPAYKMEFFEPNQLKYKGLANVDVLAGKIISLDKTDFEKLKKIFEESDFKKFESTYLKKVMDIPKVTLAYDGHKVVYHETEAPEKLKTLSKMLEAFLP